MQPLPTQGNVSFYRPLYKAIYIGSSVSIGFNSCNYSCNWQEGAGRFTGGGGFYRMRDCYGNLTDLLEADLENKGVGFFIDGGDLS